MNVIVPPSRALPFIVTVPVTGTNPSTIFLTGLLSPQPTLARQAAAQKPKAVVRTIPKKHVMSRPHHWSYNHAASVVHHGCLLTPKTFRPVIIDRAMQFASQRRRVVCIF